MKLHELGQRLKNERENQGYSLDDVYERIKISPSSLEHIEQGEVDDLPHPVYAKGFIKHYAEFLGLDGDELSNEFARIMSMEEAGLDEHDAVVDDEELPSATGGSSRKWTLFSVLASVILLAVLGWLVYDVFFVKPATEPASPSTGVESPAGVTSEPDQGGVESEDVPAGSGNETGITPAETEVQDDAQNGTPGQPEQETTVAQASGSSQDVQPPQTETEQGGQAQTGQAVQETNQATALESAQLAEEEPQETALEETRASEPEQPAQEEKHVLEISSVEACWLSADVDERSKDIYLRPGESITFRFEETLRIKLGNAGGVRLVFNGQKVPMDARSGDVKTLTFP